MLWRTIVRTGVRWLRLSGCPKIGPTMPPDCLSKAKNWGWNANYQEWVLRVPEVVVDAGVNFVVSHFELDSVSNLPVGVSLDSAAENITEAESVLCLPIAGTPTTTVGYEGYVGRTMAHLSFSAPNFQFLTMPLPKRFWSKCLKTHPGCTYDWASRRLILLRQAMTVHANGLEVTHLILQKITTLKLQNRRRHSVQLQPVEDGCYFDFDDNGDVGSVTAACFF